MEDLEEKIGRYILNIKVQKNNIDCIFGIVRLKDKLCDLLIRAEKEIDADFAQDLFINYIKTEKVFGFLDLHSIELLIKIKCMLYII